MDKGINWHETTKRVYELDTIAVEARKSLERFKSKIAGDIE